MLRLAADLLEGRLKRLNYFCHSLFCNPNRSFAGAALWIVERNRGTRIFRFEASEPVLSVRICVGSLAQR
jgi:hypothetical protein